MGTLTVSKLNDVSIYRTSSYDLIDGDVMEVSLSGDSGFVSSKITLENLKRYIVGDNASSPHQMFDIFYRTVSETPTAITIMNGQQTLAEYYSAWPLFIDTTKTNDNSINSDITKPNWIDKWNSINSSKNVRNTYPDFWNKLISLTIQQKIKYEDINISNTIGIANSLYMTDVRNLGYTGRFIIDSTNGFAALPILNNAFIRTVSTSGEDLSLSYADTNKSVVKFKQGTYVNAATQVNDFFALNLSSVSTGTSDNGGIETVPKNIRFCPYMQIANSFAQTSVIDVAASLSAYSIIPPGTVQYFALSSAPEYWLEANGSYVLTADYPALYNAISTLFGAVTGSSFKLPDLRGQFIRGWDNGRSNTANNLSGDTNYTRTLGSFQGDALQNHEHTYYDWYGLGNNGPYNLGGQGGAGDTDGIVGTNVRISLYETRPRNTALLVCIKT